MSTEWTWPAGKTFGELSPEDKQQAARQAGKQLERELTAMAPAISRVMEMADEDDARLTEAEFDKRFGPRVSQAIAFDSAGRSVVNSALTRTKYVAWNWTTHTYDVEPRRS